VGVSAAAAADARTAGCLVNASRVHPHTIDDPAIPSSPFPRLVLHDLSDDTVFILACSFLLLLAPGLGASLFVIPPPCFAARSQM